MLSFLNIMLFIFVPTQSCANLCINCCEYSNRNTYICHCVAGRCHGGHKRADIIFWSCPVQWNIMSTRRPSNSVFEKMASHVTQIRFKSVLRNYWIKIMFVSIFPCGRSNLVLSPSMGIISFTPTIRKNQYYPRCHNAHEKNCGVIKNKLSASQVLCLYIFYVLSLTNFNLLQ